MEYERFTAAELRELKTPRAVDRAELDELLAQLGRNTRSELDGIERGGLTGSERQRELEAVLAAQEYYARELLSTWHEDGTAVAWLAQPQPFRTKCRYLKLDLLRAQASRSQLHRRHLERLQTEGLITWSSAPEAATSAHDGWHAPHPDQWPIEEALERLAPPVVVAVATRLLRVLSRRNQAPRLTPEESRVAGLYQSLELQLTPVSEQDEAFLRGLGGDFTAWKGPLARELNRANSFATAAIKKVLWHVRAGIYLFVVLAPPHRAVLDGTRMDPLLDIVYQPRDALSRDEQRLLQDAPSQLRRERVGAAVDAGGGAIATPLPLEETVGPLHRAEERYATQVPGQAWRPPRFQCVVRCPMHCVTTEGNAHA